MGAYARVSYEERVEIYGYWQQGESLRSIAGRLKRQPSTVSRELRRCREEKAGYRPELAEEDAVGRRWRKPSLFRNRHRRRHVKTKLRLGWSPEQIAGRLRSESSPLYVCTESIYQWIYGKEGRRLHLYSWLPYARKQRGRRIARKPKDKIPNATSITLRPQEINQRLQFGHWECDTLLIGRLHSSAVTTLVERKTRFTALVHATCLRTSPVVGGIQVALSKLPTPARASITFDRGREFAAHQRLHALHIATYFCNPYSPWQKGAVENLNGRLRRILPKGRQTHLDQTILDRIARRFNNTPRKCLGFKTPREVFSIHLRANRCARN